MPNRQLEQRRTRLKRFIAATLATVYLFGSEGPMLLTFAAPGWFVRPGAGVSSQPLGVSSFNAPGFGDLAQAVNLANGNVYAAAGGLSFNNQMTSGDENTNKVGGSNWNLSSRLRLNGFSRTSNASFGSDNLTLNPNLASDSYYGYFAKPNVIPVNRLLSQDSPGGPAVGCGNGSQSGGFTNTGALQPGKYRLTLDARAEANMQLLYGLDTFSIVTVAGVTTNWQTFTKDFTVPAGNVSSVAMAVWETSLNNPAWEVANLSSFRLDANNNPTGANLISIPDQDMRTASWLPVCAKPTIESFSRLQKADYTGTPGTNYSGILRTDTSLPGTYKVLLEARTRNGSLTVNYGVSDVNYTANVALNTTWKTLSQTYTVTQNAGRVFEIWEQTANNPDWEIKNLSVQRIAPGSFTLSSGDGSSKLFKQTTPSFTTVPSWISRYQTTTGTTFYALDPMPGTQYVKEWVVLRQIGANYIAHYYTPDGTRVTFAYDGEYADYVQNPYQQYRSAQAGMPEGRDLTTLALGPITDLFYAAPGLISKVRDEWGRVTTYEWNTTDQTLTRVNELLRDEALNSSAARKTEFEYGNCFNGVCGNQRAVTKVTYTAPDGKGGTISRWTTFSYEWRANNTRLMLKNISRSVLGGQTTVQTTYFYDPSDRLIRVDMTDQPSIFYTFTMTGTLYRRNNDLETVILPAKRSGNALQYQVPAKFATDLYEVRLEPKASGRLEWKRNGSEASPVQLKRGQSATLGRFNVRPGDVLELRGSQGAGVKLIPLLAVSGPISTSVSVVQGTPGDNSRKESQFVFDASGQLTQKKVRDYNPWIPTAPWFSFSLAEKWLITNYTYNANGTTASIVSPSGRKDVYTYDAAGNLTKLETFVSASASTSERATSYTYDLDNRQTNEIVDAVSGTRDGVAYSYGQNKKNTYFNLHPTITTSGQTFGAIQQRVDDRYVSGSLKRGFVQIYDTSGRLTQKRSYSSGLTGVTTNFTYHTGETYGEWIQEPRQSQGTLAKQYADLVSTSDNGLAATAYWFNQFGDVIIKNIVGGLASDVNNSNVFVADRNNRKDFVTMRGFNGFGQMVFEQVYEYGRAAIQKRWNYYATGELDSSWEGQKENTTDYTYNLSGVDLGRTAGIVKGIGDGNGVNTPHETTILAYDAFGRVVTQTVDGFATTFKYDTLDRTVNTGLFNGLGTAASYHSSGIQDFNCDFGGGGSGTGAAQPDQNRCSYNYNIDGLGRVGYNNTSVNIPQTRTTYFTYDPFDRPIKVRSDALEMVASGDARATFMVYDTEGNLLKQLSPELGNSGYVDNRRPYMEYAYDGFNRKTAEKKLVRSPSPVVPSSMVLPTPGAGVQIATTTYEYDAWDRMVHTVDADGWGTWLGYDGIGNVSEKQQQVCLDNSGECAQNFSDEDSSPSNAHAGTYYAYDAAGRVTATKDARGNTSRVKYSAFGSPQYIVDARGITTKAVNYTGDGLVSSIFEPDNNPSTSAKLADDGNAAGYVQTKGFDYGSRKYPTSSCVYGINGNTTACTSYQYDFAGRPTLTSLPLGATIEQGYDGRGHLTRMKDADGFVTEYQYNAWDQLIQEKKIRRDGTIDVTALPGNLVSSYTYDLAGNLKQKIERGLYTDYWYNSLGKVQVESRPHKFGVGGEIKYYTYRVDGVKTAETSYGYDGSLITSQYNTVDCWATTPNVTAGNAQCWGDLTNLGRAGSHASFGDLRSIGGAVNAREFIEINAFNGLGLRYKRSFYGDQSIYALHRTASGAINGDDEATLWRYDANGNLLKSYKRGITGNGGGFTDSVDVSTVSPSNPQDASDVYAYNYSPTNKQTLRASEVKVFAANGNLIGRTAGAGSDNGVTFSDCVSPRVRPQSVTNINYTERDQTSCVAVSDTDFTGATVYRSTGTSYYSDGSKASVVVAGVGNQTFTYDARGRLTSNYDSNGTYGIGAATTTNYSYGASGEVYETLNGNYWSTRTPTVGGLTYSTVGAAASGFNGCPQGSGITGCPSQQSVWTYDGNGFPTRRVTTQDTKTGSAVTRTIDTEFLYDAYGNNNSRFETSSGYEYDGSSSFPVSRNVARREVYNATFSVLNAVISEKITPQNGGAEVTHNYALSSRGMRVNMTGTDTTNVFNNAAKRYDADDRAINFDRGPTQETIYSINGGPPGASVPAPVTRAIRFRYDPFGDLALSAQGATTDFGSGFYGYQTKSQSSVILDGQVHLMHSVQTTSGYGYSCTPVNSDGDGGCDVGPVGFSPPPLDQDETFSLADGAKNSDGTFDVIAPFAAPSTDSSATPLQAPVTPLSTQVKVEPSAIQAPGSLTPPSSDPGSITPPASSKPQAQPQSTGFSSGTTLNLNTTVSSQPVSTPSVGVQSFSVSSATTTASSQPATTASSGQPSQFTAQINLEAPSSVLPPSITPLSASSITSPSSLLIVTPNAGDVSSIVAPNSSMPVVGITPSSGASSVIPPSGSVNDPTSSVTPPGGSSGAIVPPGGSVGGSSGGNVKPLENRIINGNCRFVGDSNVKFALEQSDECTSTAQSLQDKADFLGETIKTSSGRSTQERADLEFQLAKTRAQRIDVVYPGGSEPRAAASVRAISENPLYQEMSPERKLAFWHVMNYGLGTGQLGRKDLADTAAAMWGMLQDKSVLAQHPELQNGTYQMGPGSSNNGSSALAGIGLAFAVVGVGGGGTALGITATGSIGNPIGATLAMIVAAGVTGYVIAGVARDVYNNVVAASRSEIFLNAKQTKSEQRDDPDSKLGTNQSENKNANRIADRLNLNPAQRRLLHDDITGQDLSLEEIERRAQQIKDNFTGNSKGDYRKDKGKP